MLSTDPIISIIGLGDARRNTICHFRNGVGHAQAWMHEVGILGYTCYRGIGEMLRPQRAQGSPGMICSPPVISAPQAVCATATSTTVADPNTGSTSIAATCNGAAHGIQRALETCAVMGDLATIWQPCATGITVIVVRVYMQVIIQRFCDLKEVKRRRY